MYARKIDGNQKDIVEVLRNFGATVEPRLSRLGRGAPDLVVGFRGINYLFEIKDKHGRLTPDQERWIAAWRGKVYIVNSAEEAIDIVFERKTHEHANDHRCSQGADKNVHRHNEHLP